LIKGLITMNKHLFFILFFFLLLILFANSVFSQAKSKQQTRESSSKINYTVSFEFNRKLSKPLNEQSDKDRFSLLNKLLLQISNTHRLEDKPPLSLLLLKRRANSDIPALQKALRSRAYYDAEIIYSLDTSIKPIKLAFLVNTGPRYVFDQVNFQLSEKLPKSSLLKLPSPEKTGLLLSAIADARLVKKAEKLLIKELKQQSYAYAKLVNKKITVNHKKHSMQILFEVNPGPAVRLGKVKFKGAKSVDGKFLHTLIGWNDKALYHPGLIKKATKNLVESNLFSTIRIELDPQIKIINKKEQVIPVIIHLKESLHRSIKASLGLDTDTGISIGTSWVHRNYFTAGEKLSIEGAWTGVGPLLDVRFNKPSFYSPKQSFVANLKLQNEDTDAYESTSLNMGVGIERKLKKRMKISLGLAFRQSQISDKTIENSQENNMDSSQNFSLLYTPMKFSWDYSNDLFDPNKGGKLLLQAAPFIDLQSNINFGKMYASYAHYLEILSIPRVILANRVAIGQILGAEVSKLPADERFFSGGGSSVRGYGYQLIGPLDKNNKPMGGSALLEFALESRISITDSIASVLFVDAGSSYSSDFFDGSSDILYGAGFGMRYASPMGPLRIDFAVPVNARDGVDDSFQIYLSIGQSF
jgi:translocation and assembly module TamA